MPRDPAHSAHQSPVSLQEWQPHTKPPFTRQRPTALLTRDSGHAASHFWQRQRKRSGGGNCGSVSQLSRGVKAGLHAGMPNKSARKKKGPRPAARSRKPRHSTTTFWWPLLRWAWEWLPLLLLLFVALAAFVLDPAAVAQLAWACMAGKFGTPVQLAVSIAAVGGAAAVAWAFWPHPAVHPAHARSGKRARPRRSAAAQSGTSGVRRRQGQARPAEQAPLDPTPRATPAHIAETSPASPEAETVPKPRRRQRPPRISRPTGQRMQADDESVVAEQPGSQLNSV